MRKDSLSPTDTARKIPSLLAAFWDSPIYLVLSALIIAVGNVFGLEKISLPYITGMAVLVALFSKTSKPYLVLWALAYMTISKTNNPGYYVEGSAEQETVSIFYDPAFLKILAVMAALIVVSHVILIVKAKKRRKLHKPAFGTSLIALGVAFLLGGVGSSYQYTKSLLFALIEFLSIAVPYFFFAITLDPEEISIDDFGKIFSAVGFALVLETAGMYRDLPTHYVNIIYRYDLFTGWGIYNNVAGMILMTIPAPLALIKKRKRVFPYFFLSTLFYLAAIFTQSRNGILVGGFIYFLSIFAVICASGRRERRKMLIFCSFTLVLLAGCVFYFKDLVVEIFSNIAEADSGRSRLSIYETGIEHFLERPLFGCGFYRATTYRWGNLSSDSFLPPRYHNTFVQLAASTGVVGLISYLFHRLQTVAAIKRCQEQRYAFLWFAILAYLLSSLLDNFFFNFGPSFTYGVFLVFLDLGRVPNAKKKKIV